MPDKHKSPDNLTLEPTVEHLTQTINSFTTKYQDKIHRWHDFIVKLKLEPAKKVSCFLTPGDIIRTVVDVNETNKDCI